LSEYILKQKFKPKNALFLLKYRKNRWALGAPPPDPLASGGSSPTDPHWLLAAGSSTPKPSHQFHHDEFLATRLSTANTE